MSDGAEVRIRARKLASGKVEFALQIGESRQWLPSQRLFPYITTTVGQWLYASWYTVGDQTTSLTTSGAGPTNPASPENARWTLDQTDTGDPIISRLATTYEYIWPSAYPDSPPLLMIGCGSGVWANVIAWRNIWPWGALEVIVRHQLDPAPWEHDEWTRSDEGMLAASSLWFSRLPIAPAAITHNASTLTVVLYDRDGWDLAQRTARETGFDNGVALANQYALLARAEFSLQGLTRALEHLDCEG